MTAGRVKGVATATALAAALAVLSPVVARADIWFDPGVPLLRADSVQGQAWAAYRLGVPEGGAKIWAVEQIFLEGGSCLIVGEMSVQRADGSRVPGGGGQLRTCGELYEYHAEVLEPPIVTLHKGNEPGGFSGDGVASRFDVPAGEYLIVMWVAAQGEVAHSDFSVYASLDTTVEGATSGTDVLLAMDDQFSGAAEVRARVVNNGTLVMAAESFSLTAGHSLFASFVNWALPPPPALIGYVAPDGQRHVTYSGWMEVLGGPPGGYTFEAYAVAEAGIFDPRVALFAADVVLPA